MHTAPPSLRFDSSRASVDAAHRSPDAGGSFMRVLLGAPNMVAITRPGSSAMFGVRATDERGRRLTRCNDPAAV
jgi:hypothetical protein